MQQEQKILMAGNCFRKSIFCFLFFLRVFAFAETADILLDEESEVRAEDNWQILKWEKNAGEVYKYKIIIEKYNRKKKSWYSERMVVADGSSESMKLDPALELGYYRYKVNSLNIIGIEYSESEWMEFKIYKAFTPKISSVTVDVNKSSSFFLEQENDGVFSVKGKNLFNVKSDDKEISYTSYSLVNSKNTVKEYDLIPYEIRSDKEILFKIDLDEIDTGTYYIVATDASGLKSEIGEGCMLAVRFRKEIDFDVSAGYIFPMVLFDETINDYTGKKVMPMSGIIKASFMPVKKRNRYFGIGSEILYSRIRSDKKDYDIDGNDISFFLTFVFQKPFFDVDRKIQKGTLELRCGAGFDFLSDVRFTFGKSVKTEPLNTINPAVLAGISYQHYLTGRFYVEGSLDFSVAFTKDMVMGSVKPGLFAGWQF